MAKKKSAHLKPLSFAYAQKSFQGFLEGTGKSQNTIESYLSDLNTFKDFLETQFGKNGISLKQLTSQDVDRYQEYLKKHSYKTNTRRRKLLTVRRLFRYLKMRNRLSVNITTQLPAPYKVERVPRTLRYDEILEKILSLPKTQYLEKRNRILLWVLLETGCTVSEVAKIRFKDLNAKKSSLKLGVKSKRSVEVSKELSQAISELKKQQDKEYKRTSEWLFLGFNKYGPLSYTSISARGVEILMNVYSNRLGLDDLTPRLLRQTSVLHEFKSGKTKEEIKDKLGLKSDYSFRVYQPLLKESS